MRPKIRSLFAKSIIIAVLTYQSPGQAQQQVDPTPRTQPVDSIVREFRNTSRTLWENTRLALEAMPAEKYKVMSPVADRTFAQVALKSIRSTNYYCSLLRGGPRPNAPNYPDDATKSEIVSLYNGTVDYCTSVVSSLDNTKLTESQSAATIITATQEWATAYQQLASYLRFNHIVPKIPCRIGVFSSCDPSIDLCHQNKFPTDWSGRLVLGGAPYSVRADDAGPYVNGASNAMVVFGDFANLLFFDSIPWAVTQHRTVTIDLDHPVPGDNGVPLGVLRVDRDMELTAQWYTQANYIRHSLFEIPIGKTVTARQINVAFHINDIAHVLQMGPQRYGHCHSDGSGAYGKGTTMGTISRLTAKKWVVNLPVGSIGRLFDNHLLNANAVNKGLYYVSLRYEIELK